MITVLDILVHQLMHKSIFNKKLSANRPAFSVSQASSHLYIRTMHKRLLYKKDMISRFGVWVSIGVGKIS
jgi:hypothetical protein